MRIRITNGHLIDPANAVDSPNDLYIADGIVASVGVAPEGFNSERVIDASGCLVIPGLIDLRARLREPGEEHKGNIASETRAAAAGGITTLCVPPDTMPVIDNPAVAELIHQRAEAAGYARVFTLGALTTGLAGEKISEMAALHEGGCVGMSNALMPLTNTLVLRRAMEYAASFGLTVHLYPFDPALTHKGCVHEGVISTRLGLTGIPEAAETIAMSRALMLIEQTGVRAHFCQLSSARSVSMLKRAQYDGLPISADVSTHHLHLTELDIGYFDTMCHVQPPLRTQRDQEGLRAGLAVDAIQAICSDHQPHDTDAKLAPFCESEPGISALETLLPLSLRLVADGVLSMPQLIARLTHQPANILGVDGGDLSPGSRADICIFDPNRSWAVSNMTLRSQGKNTPFVNWELQGQVVCTLLQGRPVFELSAP